MLLCLFALTFACSLGYVLDSSGFIMLSSGLLDWLVICYKDITGQESIWSLHVSCIIMSHYFTALEQL